MTYVMWREEHRWNVSVLQRVHLYNLVPFFYLLDTHFPQNIVTAKLEVCL
jgi:hypothetical protein